MQKCCYFLCLVMLVSSLADAQSRKHRPPRPRLPLPPISSPPKPGWIISSNLFSLMETDGGPGLAVEYRASLHWAVVLEGTALLYTGLPFYHNKGTGFRIQPELRYYFPGRQRSFRGFFSFQGSYKQKTYQDSVDVRQDDPVTGIPHFEKVDYEERRHVFAGAAISGFQIRFGKAQQFMLEAYAGLGLKYKYLKREGRPLNAEKSVSWLFPNLKEPGYYPHIPMGIRIGYCF